jgi:hypothetical protein
MNSTDIKKIVNELRSSSGTAEWKENHFKKKYQEFFETYPKLFLAAVNDNFPLKYLDLMLAQYDFIKENKTSVKEADELVYGQLRSNYIDPLVQNAEVEGQEKPCVTIHNEDGTKVPVPLDQFNDTTATA